MSSYHQEQGLTTIRSNFAYLSQHDEQLARLGLLAERYFASDPNTCLLKLRQFSELLARMLAASAGIPTSSEDAQIDLLRRVGDSGVLPREIAQLFGEVRRAGNAANHAFAGDHRIALNALKISWQIGLWFHRTFANPSFRSGPFIPPSSPEDEGIELRTELSRLRKELQDYEASNQSHSQRLGELEAKLSEAKDEKSFWEQMAVEAEQAKTSLELRLAEQQLQAATQSNARLTFLINSAAQAVTAVQLDETATREIIDQQLRQAGWEVDSQTMRYANGTRPEKGRNLAIAEWPTGTGPADYVLFVGLTPLAVVEAKRKNIDASGSLQQAKRYSRTFLGTDLEDSKVSWGEYRIPFSFSANGRPYLRQLATRSGIWFCDLRRPENLSHALDGWYTPEGLTALFRRDENRAHQKLSEEQFDYGFPLRYYQKDAIRAIEAGIASGRREMLLAMATGTGKTKTCIALIYRLLKAQRFRRILFLVDRSALGEQAANAFKDTRMENLQAFVDAFGIKELDERSPESDTAVQIATVQGMVHRILYAKEDSFPPPVDEYDCIIVDECHRGYLLDRELSDTELTFRNFEDYISKYRRVLDYFDAVKVGLTATPALHTSNIFGLPIYTYSYRAAVIDGYLIDYEPPIQIRTELSSEGIKWKSGEEVKVYDVRRNQIDLFRTPDELRIDVEDFNRKVITEPFNEVVCNYLAKELDPSSTQKTLIFCANDAHADLVVHLLKHAFRSRYGSVDDDAVLKITGAAEKPLQLIRRFKNERNPNVAVTVDLLTTGVDVPEICNLVFLRRVNSRILFDQMLGRATRLCDEVGKETFRVFDAVRIFEALNRLTAMTSVVADPKISFVQLSDELARVTDDDIQHEVLDQFVAKLQRKKRHLGERAFRDLESTIGMTPDALIGKTRNWSPSEVRAFFSAHRQIGEILDRKGEGPLMPLYISEHPDQLRSIDRGYRSTSTFGRTARNWAKSRFIA